MRKAARQARPAALDCGEGSFSRPGGASTRPGSNSHRTTKALPGQRRRLSVHTDEANQQATRTQLCTDGPSAASFAIEHRVKGIYMAKRHNERCKGCKVRIQELLATVFGEVMADHSLDLPSRIADYRIFELCDSLEQIHGLLQQSRGYENFVRAKKLPKVDFFVPDPGIIVEFDESQHFTKPRKITLDNYPEELHLGFDKEKWKSLCSKFNRQDNDPPYRDEQRAWYDTLRDFAPSVLGLRPTVRLYASDYLWCSLAPSSRADLEMFQEIMQYNQKGHL